LFGKLVESQRCRPRAWNWITASVVFHSVLITMAVTIPVAHPKDLDVSIEQRVNMVLTPVHYSPSQPEGPPRVRPKAAEAQEPAMAVPVVEPTTKLATPLHPILPHIPIPPLTVPPVSRMGMTLDPDGNETGSDDAGSGDGEDQAGRKATPAMLLPDVPLPVYPPTLREKIKGVVHVRYIIDTLGRVERGTVRVISAPHPLLGEAAQAWLERVARFKPAQFMNGRKVRQLSDQDFTFTMLVGHHGTNRLIGGVLRNLFHPK